MANIRDLKKDINYVLEGAKIIDSAIATFDDLIAKVNQRSVENRPEHLRGVRSELQQKGADLIAQLNKLS